MPANLTRTGVFKYTYADGSTVRELRHPDEVFAPASLATLTDATVIEGHPDVVRPDNWQSLAVGHVHEATRNGKFVTAKVIVQHGPTISKVDSGELIELSCGYECNVVEESGVYEGEAYDSKQTDIRYNHVGMGPRDWGRAGNEVQLNLDGGVSRGDGSAVCYIPGMKTDAEVIAELRADLARVTADSAKADKAKADALEAKYDAKVAELAVVQAKLDAALAAGSPEAVQAKVDAKVTLLSGAKSVLGEKFDGKGTDEEVYVQVIKAKYPERDLEGKSVDYLRAAFDGVVTDFAKGEDSLGAARKATSNPGATGGNKIAESQAKMKERNAKAWAGAPKGSN